MFTIPRTIATIALQNRRVTLSILFRAATQSLGKIESDPDDLGTQIGDLARLNTWGQYLQPPTSNAWSPPPAASRPGTGGI